MAVEKPKQIECGECLYKGCFIQESEHPQLIGKYEVFKNDKATLVGVIHLRKQRSCVKKMNVLKTHFTFNGA